MFHFEEVETSSPVISSLVLTFLDLLFYSIVFYCNFYLLIPRVLKTYGVPIYVITIIPLLLIVFNLGILSPLFENVDLNGNYFSDFDMFVEAFFYLADLSIFVVVSLSYWYFKQHRIEKEKALHYQNEKLHAQLQFLRSQISPHFLFNSLNNIYSLIIQKDDNASLMVEKIADMLRYIIYEGKNKKVSMNKEIMLVENYIDLQYLKKMKNVELIEYTRTGDFSQKEIVPLLLMNCVENCFKHSNLETNPKAVLHINVAEENNKLILHTRNSYTSKPTQKNKNSFQYLKQQLNHHYPNRHSFSTSDKKGVFTFELTLDLV
ncbi:histidine kinase [Flavobacteriaceae bacterium S356]|uniref:Histidine kinase n=1 Tax=Asprobacillus argus TaxID=3076534 RepID=A0ABU3LDD0_9FLAO|nr:histidine kinase [Flavobacteriaceae bacterium S356]